MRRAGPFLLALFLADPGPAEEPLQGLVSMGLLLAPSSPADCLSPAERKAAFIRDAKSPALEPSSGRARLTDAAPLPFHPQGGLLHRDLAVNNYVDLDPSALVRDFQCTGWAYDGHNGHDVDLRSFAEQDAGVPIFAPLDGTVDSTHDGEPDRNTVAQGQPASYVILAHAGGHLTYYWHLKNGSVAVSAGQNVVAGQQLGLTGSSGSSTYPHLHFETRVDGVVYEPYAGACRPGTSGWVTQPPAQPTPAITDWVYSPVSFAPYVMPEDGAPRTGAFTTGASRPINFRPQITGLPAGATYRVRFLRPDASVALDYADSLHNPQHDRHAIYYFQFFVNLDVAGTWRTLFDLNGATVADAPFEAVAPGVVPVNRAPNPVRASLVIPAGSGVPFCRVDASPVTPDPDYDRVSFRYLWKVNAAVARDRTFASLSDALPRTAALPGDLVECEVTPTDGTASAPTASARLRVPDPAAGDANTDGLRDVFDVVLLSSLIVGNSTAGVPPFTGPLAKMNLNPSTDAVVDVFDLVLLAGFVVGNVPSLPQ